jgi:MFS family permease
MTDAPQVAAPAPAGFDRERIAALTAAIACVAVVGVGLSLSIPLLSLEMERMGLSGAVIGLNTALAGVASICVVPFVPRLAARLGVLTLLWLSLAVAVASFLGFRLLYDIVWWFPLRFLFSAAFGTLFVLSEYWINAAAPPHRRGLVMGVYATVLALGFAVGPAVLKLVGTSGWPPYLVGAALYAAAALPLAAGRGLTPELEGRPKRSVLSFILAAPIATLAALAFGAAETGGFALLPIYGLRIGFGEDNAAFLVSILAIGTMTFQIPIGLVSDRVDRRLVLLAAGSAGTLGALLMPVTAGQGWGFYATLLVWSGLIGALYTVGLAHLGARFTGADLASANAAFVILYNVGLTLGPPVVGGAMDLLPPHGFAWSMAAIFAAYTAVVAWRLAAERRPDDAAERRTDGPRRDGAPASPAGRRAEY